MPKLLRWSWCAVLAVAVVLQWSGGCGQPAERRGAAPGADAPLRAVADVAPPPGVAAESLRPRDAQQMPVATMTLAQVLETLPQPELLTKEPPAAPAGEPPVAAQRAYLEARQAWRDGRGFEAIQALQRAERVAPNQPSILRLMGKIYSASGNRLRGAQYLEQALAVDRDDAESLLLLAAYDLDRNQPQRAAVLLARAAELLQRGREEGRRSDPALPPLLQFYLGNALEKMGHDAAAIGQYRGYLDLPRYFGRSTALVREVAFLYRQRGATWQTVGDLHNRLGQLDEALQAYRAALDAGDVDGGATVARVVYTLLRGGRTDAAQAAVLDLLRKNPTDAQGAALVRYLGEQKAIGAGLVGQVQALYEQSDAPAGLVVELADLAGPEQAQALLRAHLARHPHDIAVFQRLLRLSWNGAAKQSRQAAAAATFTLQAVAAAPGAAREYVGALVDLAQDDAALLAVVLQLPEAEREAAAGRYAVGLLRRTLGQAADAEAALRGALAADETLLAARLELAELLVAAERYADAEAVLAPVAEQPDARLVALRARVLTETGRFAEALALIDRMLESEPMNTDLVLSKAVLQLRSGDSVAAERTLEDALNLQPTSERIYEALFELYESAAAPPDAIRQYQRLMRRLLGTIPNSRIGRLQRAELHDARSEFDQAEKLLRGLLEEDANDARALAALLQVLVRSERGVQADELIEQRLTAAPEERWLLQVAVAHFERTGNRGRQAQVLERLLLQMPPTAQRARGLALLYLQRMERPDRAAEVLMEALRQPVDDPRGMVGMLVRALGKTGRLAEADGLVRPVLQRHPEREADLWLEWAMGVDGTGDRAGAEKMMEEILAKHPDHAATNNSLGYTWADQGRNLERAEAMIRKALDAEPNSAAYLDSMGWVLYKRGQFAEALVWLQRAKGADEGAGMHPVILDHVGDTLYRLNQKGPAVSEWQTALTLWRREAEQGQAEDAEMKGLDGRLGAKIEAVQQDRAAPVAAVVGEAGPGAAPGAAPAAEAGATPGAGGAANHAVNGAAKPAENP